MVRAASARRGWRSRWASDKTLGYLQGTVFEPLASIAEPELVLPCIPPLGVGIEGVRPPVDVLVEQFGNPPLLVLDNLEQVVGVAPDLDQLLGRCPGLEILATSRTVLRLRAEREYRVGALSAALSGRVPIEQVVSSPAVRLFLDRAQAGLLRLCLDRQNALAVVEICPRLDGVPLAIELAAARVRLLEPEALLARLGSRLDVFGTGPVDLPERHARSRATVEWSVGLLDDAEQHMLAALSTSSKAGRSRRLLTSPASPKTGRLICSTRLPVTAW